MKRSERNQKKVNELQPHPKQKYHFGERTEAEIASLVASMAQRGQEAPIEILPDGTIVSGHGRWQAAQVLGWEEVKVRIMRKLAEQGEQAIEAHLILANAEHRQFPRARRAKLGAEAYLLVKGSPEAQTMDEVAAKFGVSTRQLSRWVRALTLPPSIQQELDSLCPRGHIRHQDAHHPHPRLAHRAQGPHRDRY